jgi:formate--tetrahydrofolate ligase
MAIVALAASYHDLEERLGRIVVGTTAGGAPITASDVGAAGAMTALLRDALLPNLVQTAEGGPALVHAGPFGNIAHGCSSILATRLGLQSSDYAVTEAGFGFDLGGEKFLDIKCRAAGIWPRALVLVATLRALRMHGGAKIAAAGDPDPAALEKGLAHLEKHLETAAFFGLPVVVAINVFPNDTADELALVDEAAKRRGVRAARCEGFARGGEGALDLARAVIETADATDRAPPAPRYVYELASPVRDKVTRIAQVVYGAAGADFAPQAQKDLKRIDELGYTGLPVCMAKTQLSLTDDPAVYGRPTGFTITVREVRLSAGAGFVVPLTGEMMTMPGLPREPAALRVKLLENGRIRGLMQHDD